MGMNMHFAVVPVPVDMDEIVVLQEFSIGHYFHRTTLSCYPLIFIKDIN
jgi:hypothetical protein